jgi:hypothetical protein
MRNLCPDRPWLRDGMRVAISALCYSLAGVRREYRAVKQTPCEQI